MADNLTDFEPTLDDLLGSVHPSESTNNNRNADNDDDDRSVASTTTITNAQLQQDLESGELLDDIEDEEQVLRNLCEEASTSTNGPPVSNAIKSLVDALFCRDYHSSNATTKMAGPKSLLTKVIEKFDGVPTPSNLADTLKPKEVNGPVAKAAFRNPNIRKLHQSILKCESTLDKAVCSDIKVVEKLISIKKLAPKNRQLINMVDEVIKQSSLSLEIQGLCKSNINRARKELLTDFINPQFKPLADNSSSGSKLFGEELQKEISEIEVANKLSNKLSATKSHNGEYSSRSFLGHRSRDRSPHRKTQRYQPYQRSRPAERQAYQYARGKSQSNQNSR